MKWWEILLLVLLLAAFAVAIALLIVAVKNWQNKHHEGSSSYADGWGGHRKPLVPSFTYVYSTGAAIGMTGTIPFSSQSPVSTTDTLLLTGPAGLNTQVIVGKHGAGRYRVDFTLTIETGSTGPILADIFVDNTPINSIRYGPPAVNNSGVVHGFGLVMLQPGSTVELRILSGTVIIAANKTNASMMLQRLANFTHCANG
jgi:hypothetical protein